MNIETFWRMRPTPYLSGAWTYFVTLTDLRTDVDANGIDRAEVEVFDGEGYAPYGVLRAAYGILCKVPYEEQSPLTPSQPPAA